MVKSRYKIYGFLIAILTALIGFWLLGHLLSNQGIRDTILMLFIILAVSVTALLMHRKWTGLKKENNVLEAQIKQYKLVCLQQQIQPHFLFNTLHNLYWFAVNKSPQMPVLVKKLGSLQRYLLKDCNSALVPVSRELQMIKHYLALEEIRYANGLRITVKQSGNLVNKYIPPLLLISFVENSFKHGASKVLKNPCIKMCVVVNKNALVFTIINNKPTLVALQNGETGIGLSNLKKQLELLYPANHQLKILCTVNNFFVVLKIPVATKQVDKSIVKKQRVA